MLRPVVAASILVLQQHAFAALQPEQQTEKSWVDGRWAQTDVGQFLASAVPLPNGTVAKGLSIRVGDGNSTMCYDTGGGMLRAAWTGGFLKFDPARFGLIRWPKPDGEMRFVGPARSHGSDTFLRYLGLRVSGKRILLSWQGGNAVLHESPSYETSGDAAVFMRTFEVSGGNEIRLGLFDSKKGRSSLRSFGDKPGAIVETENGLIALVWQGSKRTAFETNDDRVSLYFPAREQNETGKLIIWTGSRDELSKLEQARFNTPRDLARTFLPGPSRWMPELTTRGQLGVATDIFAVDTLTVPYENPWKALMFLSGVDLLSNGTAFASAIHGDVWRVTGIDDTLRTLQWKRFATGLFQPLGLRIVNGRIYVLGRDQITELVDENGDGEADVYRNFCNLIDTSSGGHDYVTCLELDSAGNFYYVDPRGVHRISSDGARKETIASGWRNPNGLGVGPGGIITVAPQQGEWTPSSAIYEVKPGGFYGYGGPRVGENRPLGYDEPLCWIPHSADNSSGSQVWVPEGVWGPFAGQMLHLVWGRCSMMLVLRDASGEVPHGATIPLPGRFLSGPMRGAFSPYDGNLYVAGCTGWQTSAVKDGSLQRVRFTGKPVQVPIAFRVETNGIALTFSQPLAEGTAQDTGSYGVTQWNYKYTKEYGSFDWSVADPSKKERDPVEVTAATLSADKRSVFLEIPQLRPVMQMEIKYNLDAADARKLRGAIYTTIHRRDLPPSRSGQ